MYNPYDREAYPVRKNTRLKKYDYTSANCYFVTVCTYEKRCIFGEPGGSNPLAQIVKTGICNIPDHYHGVQIHHYVIMPNHVHILLQLPGNTSGLEQIIGSWKAHSTREIHKLQPEIKVWQTSFHDHIIRNEQDYQRIWQYIEGNPLNWQKDCFFQK